MISKEMIEAYFKTTTTTTTIATLILISSLSISTANQNTSNALFCENFNNNITLDLEPCLIPPLKNK
jgi:hypothetical protein